MQNQSFSKRHGLKPKEAEITTRNEAPIGLREFIVQTVKSLGYEPDFLRQTICRVLKRLPDRNNWSPYPNIFNEAVDLINECNWYYVYDIIEVFNRDIKVNDRQSFQEEINDFFLINGIGWKLEEGQIQFRGDESFEVGLDNAVKTLEKAKQQTARTEIKEALSDLSRRPEPDITGAVQHSLACLECVARAVSGNSKETLGALIKKYSNIVPKPLDDAISKIWGFTSEQGRHLREGGEPDYKEAELIVGLSAVLSTYLGKKLPMGSNDEEDNWY